MKSVLLVRPSKTVVRLSHLVKFVVVGRIPPNMSKPRPPRHVWTHARYLIQYDDQGNPTGEAALDELFTDRRDCFLKSGMTEGVFSTVLHGNRYTKDGYVYKQTNDPNTPFPPTIKIHLRKLKHTGGTNLSKPCYLYSERRKSPLQRFSSDTEAATYLGISPRGVQNLLQGYISDNTRERAKEWNVHACTAYIWMHSIKKDIKTLVPKSVILSFPHLKPKPR